MEKSIVRYKPFSERTPDSQYSNILRQVLETGIKKTSIHASLPENQGSGHKYCLELSGLTMKYSLENGVPVTPIRNLGNLWQGAIGEIIAFINGARTLQQLEEYGCPKAFWEKWVTKDKCNSFGLEEFDLGPGSYGAILTHMPGPNGEQPFNQIDALIKQMQEKPFLRTHCLSTWYAPYALGDMTQNSPRKVVVAPCHGNLVQFNVFDNKNMHMVHVQRSADTPVGLALNMVGWPAFGMMTAYMTGLNFTEYHHMLPNPQLYDVQFDIVRELIERKHLKLPSLYLRPGREIKSIYDFRKEDFYLEDYYPHAKVKIPTAI